MKDNVYIEWKNVPILLNVKEVAILFNCSEKTVKRRLENGDLKGSKVIGKWMVSKEYLMNLVA